MVDPELRAVFGVLEIEVKRVGVAGEDAKSCDEVLKPVRGTPEQDWLHSFGSSAERLDGCQP